MKKLTGFGLLLGILAAHGCHSSSEGQPVSDLFPDKPLPKSAVLILAGSRIPVDFETETKETTVTYKLLSHGQTLEVEEYQRSSAGASLILAAGEVYDPPIPLLKQFTAAGDEWDWSGSVHNKLPGSEAQPATKRDARAKVKVKNGMLNITGGPYRTLQVTVELSIHDGSAKPVPRPLNFHFVNGSGLISRDFAFSSTREPAD